MVTPDMTLNNWIPEKRLSEFWSFEYFLPLEENIICSQSGANVLQLSAVYKANNWYVKKLAKRLSIRSGNFRRCALHIFY